MLVFTSENIREIDEYAAGALAISTTELMGRAGAAVAREAEKLCNKVAIIKAGKVLAVGSMSDIVKEGQSLEDIFMEAIRDDETN